MDQNAAARETIELSSRRFAELLERYVPGFVTGLHLVGSATDGDFHAGRSDLDFVAVISRPMGIAELEAIGIVHRLYGSDPTLPLLDGIWITEDDLVAGPDATPDGPTSRDGQFLAAARGNRNPVAWAQLPNAASIVGTVNQTTLWSNPARLASWTHENAETYWTGWLTHASNLLSPRGLIMLGRREPMWGVLGISRLHYTLATGHIASKIEAGRYALTWVEPRWHRIVEECLRTRQGKRGFYGNPFSRRRDALDYVAMVIAEIRARWGADGRRLV